MGHAIDDSERAIVQEAEEARDEDELGVAAKQHGPDP